MVKHKNTKYLAKKFIYTYYNKIGINNKLKSKIRQEIKCITKNTNDEIIFKIDLIFQMIIVTKIQRWKSYCI